MELNQTTTEGTPQTTAPTSLYGGGQTPSEVLNDVETYIANVEDGIKKLEQAMDSAVNNGLEFLRSYKNALAKAQQYRQEVLSIIEQRRREGARTALHCIQTGSIDHGDDELDPGSHDGLHA